MAAGRTVISLPGSTYLFVAFLAVCVTALVRSPILFLLYLIPLAAGIYVYRTATIVDETGLTARALFGSATLSWTELRGLKINPRGAVYAVETGGTQVRLPCVRQATLPQLVAASDGRIPDPAG